MVDGSYKLNKPSLTGMRDDNSIHSIFLSRNINIVSNQESLSKFYSSCEPLNTCMHYEKVHKNFKSCHMIIRFKRKILNHYRPGGLNRGTRLKKPSTSTGNPRAPRRTGGVDVLPFQGLNHGPPPTSRAAISLETSNMICHLPNIHEKFP